MLIYFPTNQNFHDCKYFLDYEKKYIIISDFILKKVLIINVLVYYHGNYDSMCESMNFKKNFEKTNNNLIFFEYARYSNDNKKLSKLILKDVENINLFIFKKDMINFLYMAKILVVVLQFIMGKLER
ncbi:MAG: hypothetical protein ACLFPJ_03560 [Candidatus Woesearchaeota archaeon]